MDFLQTLNQQGTAILLISHDYKLVYRYAERVFLMEAGRIKLEGRLAKPRKEVLSHQAVALGL
jgi:energy-coupling factor transporter ATP-binding protein EcfA2